MSAPNPVPPATTGGDVRPYEPSMEEILASIRRIIADDQSLPGRRPIEEAVHAEDSAASVHVLRTDAARAELNGEAASIVEAEPAIAYAAKAGDGQMSAQGTITAPQFPTPAGPHDAPALSPVAADSHHLLHDEPAGVLTAATVEPERDLEEEGNDYFDPPHEYDRPAVAPVDATPLFSATTNTTVSSAFNVLAASRLADNSEELLGMAREMIRPLLRVWLDENLPSMVERLVREEIERVARGGR